MKETVQALRLLLVLTLLTGVGYPVAVFVVGQALFFKQANGSPVVREGKLAGSELLAQKFESNRYFWPRPSAGDYATVPSSASNLGPTSAALRKAVAERRSRLGENAPAEMLTASGSGLDPHISPEAAMRQVGRVAATRNRDRGEVKALVQAATEGPQFGFLGEPRVNVFALNLRLDTLK